MDDRIGALKHTPLHDLHAALGARMVPFAGYALPVQFPDGTLKECAWTRDHAGLFDVSHMGQALLIARDGRHATVAAALEALVPASILGLRPGQQRYTQLLAGSGGIVDDLMVTRAPDPAKEGILFLVVNAARKEIDYAFIAERLPEAVDIEPAEDRALLALQGPSARRVLYELSEAAAALPFMTACETRAGDVECQVSCSGYTGEDGFEISTKSSRAAGLAELLLRDGRVKPIGLAARDVLRLEAGHCLYGHELDETTSPVEAGLLWSIPRRRRVDGGFPGAARIQAELEAGPAKARIGMVLEGRVIARAGTEILSSSNERIGTVTSGGYGPSLDRPIAMGYVAATHADTGSRVRLLVRGKALEAHIVELPFVPHRYWRPG